MNPADSGRAKRSRQLRGASCRQQLSKLRRARGARFGPTKLAHRLIQLLDVGDAQVGQAKMPEDRGEIERDVLGIRAGGCRTKLRLAHQPLCKISPDGLPACVDVGALVNSVQQVRQRDIGILSGDETTPALNPPFPLRSHR